MVTGTVKKKCLVFGLKEKVMQVGHGVVKNTEMLNDARECLQGLVEKNKYITVIRDFNCKDILGGFDK